MINVWVCLREVGCRCYEDGVVGWVGGCEGWREEAAGCGRDVGCDFVGGDRQTE